MANDVSIKDSNNAVQTVATDDIGGRQYQIVKPAFGIEDSAILVSTTNPLPTAFSAVLRIAITNRSGQISTGGTAQQAAATNASRNYLLIQNPSNAGESLWYSLDTIAVAASPAIELQPGQSYESTNVVPTGAVSVIAATTGHKYTVKEG